MRELAERGEIPAFGRVRAEEDNWGHSGEVAGLVGIRAASCQSSSIALIAARESAKVVHARKSEARRTSLRMERIMRCRRWKDPIRGNVVVV
jgi:hypothetical protein